MTVSAEHLRFILGLKLRNLRTEKAWSLKEMAQAAGLSVSYLSEIEKGKKYPTPDKLIQLASALEVPYDELVSMSVDSELAPIKQVFGSTFIQEFPFDLFGLVAQDLFSLIVDSPTQAVALLRTILDIGRTYDVEVEHFLFAALRSYQQMHGNYFEDLEKAAQAYRETNNWPDEPPISVDSLRATLIDTYGYHIDDETLVDDPDLSGFRTVFVDKKRPTLFINSKLNLVQQAFIFCREIGFRHLGFQDRPRTSSWIKASSFAQVLNNFKASYFAGAMLIQQDRLHQDLQALFQQPRWDAPAFLDLFARYQATPEMLYYRLTQLIPKLFDLNEIYFVRFHNDTATDRFRLTKVLNLSRVPVPYGMAHDEHHCQRWPAMKLLHTLAAQQESGNVSAPMVGVQRSCFIDDEVEYFVISLVRPLSLRPGTNSSVSLGFLMDDTFKRTVRFWDDPAIPRVDVNLTCERCPLTAAQCQDRVAPPKLFEAELNQKHKEEALVALFQQIG